MDTELVTIPKEQPKPFARPQYREKTPNWADKDETVATFLKNAKAWFEYLDGQGERTDYHDIMDDADRMYRVSQTRDTSSDQHQSTLSNVTSTSYFRRIRRRSTEMKGIILGGEEQTPVKMEPLDPNDAATKQTADAANMYLQHVMEVDKARAKLGQTIFFVTKYANELVSLEWDYRVDEREQREVTVTQDGKSVAKWKTVKENIANHPTFLRHDLKDAWFDARIDDMQQQRCILVRGKIGVEGVLENVQSGHYTNADKLTKDQLYQGEGDKTDLSDRKSNAGLTHSDEPDGLFRKWEVWMRAPINDKGEWDATKTAPRWCWATFMGDLSGTPVCVRLSPNPYKHKRNPFKLLHTHDDDIGAFHLGMPNILACNYEEETTTINQTIENKTLRTRKQFIAEKGSLLTRDLTSGSNKVIWKKPGSEDPHEIEIQDTTQNTLQMLQWIQTDGDRAAQTEGAMAGEALGGRASASEAKTVFDQQVKPMLEDAFYFADQLLPWYAEGCIELARQYLDPDEAVALNVRGMLYDLQPKQLYGQVKAKIVSVREYEKNAVRRLEENNLLSTTLTAVVQLSPETAKQIIKQVYQNRKFEGVSDWFTDRDDSWEAMEIAKQENHAILFDGVLDMPKPEENHAAHKRIHEPMLALYVSLPKEQRNEDNERQMQIHIAVHTYYEQRGAMQQQAMAGGPGGAETMDSTGAEGGGMMGTETQPSTSGSPGTMEGTVQGDMMAGAAGGMNA